MNNQIQARKDNGQATTDLELTLANKRIEIAKNEANEKKDLAQKEKDAKMALFDATSNALSALSNAVGEETATGKTLAVASALIDTYSGANKALAAGAGTPIGYINMAAILATGFANVRKIVSTPIPGQTIRHPRQVWGQVFQSLVVRLTHRHNLHGVWQVNNKSPSRHTQWQRT